MRPIGSKAELEQRRRLGVALHRSGQSIREVARQIGCAPGSVARWTKMFGEGGDDALDPIPGPGSKGRMTDEDRAKLRAFVQLGARVHGFSTEMWTLRRLREVIERELGIRYSISQTHTVMHRIGFSPQKAVRRAREQDEAAVEQFRKTDWRLIKKKPNAKAERSR